MMESYPLTSDADYRDKQSVHYVVNKKNIAEVPVYLGNVMPIFVKNGGKPMGRLKTIKHLSGDNSPEMIAVIEFPSTEVIAKIVNGKDFTGLAESRAKAFKKLDIVICEQM